MIDIGNTHSVIGLFENRELKRSWRLSSQANRTEDECWIVLRSFFKSSNLDALKIKGACISSVVPEQTLIFSRMIEKYLKIMPFIISADSKMDMNILYQDPHAVGADRLCNAVAGKSKYGSPLIILDFGTATTFDCVNKNGDYQGGVISPGLESAAGILHRKAAKLPKIELVFPANLIGRNTEESMQSGIMFGTLIMIEGMIRKLKKELGGEPKVIATGGLSKLIAEHTELIDAVEPDLNLHGIYQIYRMNKA